MSSTIEGYNYDIFISYRQKDNKYDGWVTEFVDNLKKELEATFKEQISVYFDINPSDYLLETYDVDASLKDKLKCLVFIPIISRTYCDPKAFAWEYEFKAFIEQASHDQFGLKVKVSGGNVANRVLPVQIHELDLEDKKLVEDELGGFIRGIEFIYNEPGVNRPLRANEDHPDNNFNKTFYRNQINKVANAIREILSGLNSSNKGVSGNSEEELSERPISKSFPGKYKRKILIAAISLFVVLAVSVWFASKLLTKQHSESGISSKSIAILPFINLGSNKENEYFSDGITEDILTNLSKIADLRVISRTSVMQYKGTTKSIREIGKELKVSTILEGSVQRADNQVRITAQLIDVQNDQNLWAETYDEKITAIFTIQSNVAKKIAEALKAKLTIEEKQRIEKNQTLNLTAYEFYLRGRESYYRYKMEDNENAITLFKKALRLDPNYVLAKAGLADAYVQRSVRFNLPKIWLDSSIYISNEAIKNDPCSSEGFKALAIAYLTKGYITKGLHNLQNAIACNPNYHPAVSNLGLAYYFSGDLVNGVLWSKKALSLSPDFFMVYQNISEEYRLLGEIKKAEYYAQKSVELLFDDGESYYSLAMAYVEQKKYDAALKLIPRILETDTNSVVNLNDAGYIAELSGNVQLAKACFHKAIQKKASIDDFWVTRIFTGAGEIMIREGKNAEGNQLLDSILNVRLRQIESGVEYFEVYYNVSGIYSMRNENDMALTWLKKAAKMGWRDFRIVQIDPWFQNLLKEEAFIQLLKEVNEKVTKMRGNLNVSDGEP